MKTYRLLSYYKQIILFLFIFCLIPAFTFSQDPAKQLLDGLFNRAKQETADFASRKLSKQIAKTLGFAPLVTLSRGDRSLSAQQKRDAKTAQQIFLNAQRSNAPIDNTRVNNANPPAIRRYEVLSETDIYALEQAFKPYLDRIQQEIDNPKPPGSIAIQPGQKRRVDFQGYCLDKGIAAPRTEEGFQLLPVSELLPGDAAPYFAGLLQYGQTTNRHHEVQGLIWRLVHGITPDHEPVALATNEIEILNTAVPGGSQAFYNYLKGNYQKSQYSFNALYQNYARELVQDAINQYVNPVFGNSGIQLNMYRQDLSRPAEIGDYLNRLSEIPVEGKTESGSEYTLLADRIAARSISTQDVQALSIEIVNQSDAIYYYQPTQYIALSTRQTQPVGHFPKEGQEEEDPLLLSSIEEVLRFFQANPELLEYAGYTAAGIAALLAIPEITIPAGLIAAARLIAGSVARLRTLGVISRNIINGLKNRLTGKKPAGKEEPGISPGENKPSEAGRVAEGFDVTRALENATSPYNGSGLSNAGRAVTKHPEYFGFESTGALRKVYRTDGAINNLGASRLKDILRNGTKTTGAGGRYPKGWVTYTLPNGNAASWELNGTFIGFRGLK